MVEQRTKLALLLDKPVGLSHSHAVGVACSRASRESQSPLALLAQEIDTFVAKESDGHILLNKGQMFMLELSMALNKINDKNVLVPREEYEVNNAIIKDYKKHREFRDKQHGDHQIEMAHASEKIDKLSRSLAASQAENGKLKRGNCYFRKRGFSCGWQAEVAKKRDEKITQLKKELAASRGTADDWKYSFEKECSTHNKTNEYNCELIQKLAASRANVDVLVKRVEEEKKHHKQTGEYLMEITKQLTASRAETKNAVELAFKKHKSSCRRGETARALCWFCECEKEARDKCADEIHEINGWLKEKLAALRAGKPSKEMIEAAAREMCEIIRAYPKRSWLCWDGVVLQGQTKKRLEEAERVLLKAFEARAEVSRLSKQGKKEG